MAQILGNAGRLRLLMALPETERTKFALGKNGFMNGARLVHDETMMSLYKGHGDELHQVLITPVANEVAELDRLFPDPADEPALAMGDTRRA